MTKLRVAVVGAGYLGRFHAQKFESIAAAELVGVCDIRADAGEDLARACDTVYYADSRDLAGQVDAVTIAANTSAHFELAKFFLENGVHVFVEKPMTNTSEQGRELTALADTNDLKLQVGHVERFNPALLSARDRLGAVQFIECHRLAPFKHRGADVNVVLDLMIHDLDVIISMVAGNPSLVSAVGISVLTSSVDIANARIEFDTGAIANVTASRVSTNTQRKFRVFQEEFGQLVMRRSVCRDRYRVYLACQVSRVGVVIRVAGTGQILACVGADVADAHELCRRYGVKLLSVESAEITCAHYRHPDFRHDRAIPLSALLMKSTRCSIRASVEQSTGIFSSASSIVRPSLRTIRIARSISRISSAE